MELGNTPIESVQNKFPTRTLLLLLQTLVLSQLEFLTCLLKIAPSHMLTPKKHDFGLIVCFLVKFKSSDCLRKQKDINGIRQLIESKSFFYLFKKLKAKNEPSKEHLNYQKPTFVSTIARNR